VATLPQDLTYLTEDYPPENYVEAGHLTGFAVDILRAVWKNLGVPDQPIQVLPWARGYALVQRQPNQVLFAMARNADREKLFQWVGPIVRTRYSLFSLADRVPALATLDEAKNLPVAVINGDVGDQLLQDARFPDADLNRVNSLAQALRMLKLGRVRLVCTGESAIREAVALEPDLAGPYKAALTVEDIQVYYAFNKDTDPALVARFQKALGAVEAERKAILRRYGMVE
jgi:polar amino acid transport system substrate-binding protein